jgi:hypothetical protein
VARIRTIKPEFFTSEDICGLSPLARLLYVALWCEADKEGRLTWKPKTFKLRYFPADACQIEDLARELVDSNLVVLYGDGLAYIPGFTTHQHVNPRESVSILPPPPGVENAGPKKVGKNLRALVMERDGGACVRCGSTDRVEIDHILPQSCGGPHIAENLRVLCKSCNAARPVAGTGLDEDLAKDGLTVESLRVKFGIDASNLDLHVQVGREGKGKEGKDKSPPNPPQGGSENGEDQQKPKRGAKIGFEDFRAACRELGEKPIPEDDAVFAYADGIGLPHAFIGLAWRWFKGRYADKQQVGIRGWRQTFRNAVEGNWPKFWFQADAGGWELTTAGKQAKRAAEAEAEAEASPQGEAA